MQITEKGALAQEEEEEEEEEAEDEAHFGGSEPPVYQVTPSSRPKGRSHHLPTLQMEQQKIALSISHLHRLFLKPHRN